jgi:hypothetical protein
MDEISKGYNNTNNNAATYGAITERFKPKYYFNYCFYYFNVEIIMIVQRTGILFYTYIYSFY